MEKRLKNINIAITGPESTGKTIISSQLSKYFHGFQIPEYAREYILNLNREYKYEDIEHIATIQIESFIQANTEYPKLLFFDTWLIITKVWFQEVFGRSPKWLRQAIQDYKMDLYLICAPDIEWVKDEVRENGGERRIELYNIYLEELKKQNITFKIVRGKDELRFKNAIEAVESFFKLEGININQFRGS
ncbi:MAG: ATP-binding protein [Bacteroidales bacterium]|nr:ATP-binding protein [Bacteroidales bacterium]